MKKFLAMLVMAAVLFSGVVGCSSTPTTKPATPAADKDKAPAAADKDKAPAAADKDKDKKDKGM